VYYPREGKALKELTAKTQAELEGLLRIGWTTEKPEEPK
jgi:hypothetical protein